jgi:hypothetical protein
MMKRMVWIVLIIFGMAGCATVPKGSGSAPVLEKSFVSPEVKFGDTVKLYFRASDPDGDMKFVLTDVGRKSDIKGKSIYPGANRLRGENQKSVSGYLAWESSRAVAVQEGGTLSGQITIWVEDAAGNQSEKQSHVVTVLPSGAKTQSPPAGEFSEIHVGSIIVDTRSFIDP